jgi:hypothetical protein
MQHSNSKKVFNHLEFLGYELEMQDEKGDYDTYLAKADSKANLYIKSNEKVFYARSFWSGFDARALKSKDFYNQLNQLNSEGVLVKAVFSEPDEAGSITIITSALYYGYDKPSFGIFIESFQSETTKIVLGLQEYTK